MKTTLSLFVLFAALGVMAHPGGLDAKGGHTDSKTGVYHYHRGTNTPSGNPAVEAPSPPMPPASPVAPLQNPAAEPASALHNLPWWIYLAALGCGYAVWELASNYYQRKKDRQ